MNLQDMDKEELIIYKQGVSDGMDLFISKMNEDEPGKGDKWKEYWQNCKQNKYEPRFEELFSKYSEKIEIADTSSDIVMLVKTTFIDPGFNVGVMRKPSLVNLTVSFKKGDEELAVITILQSPGNTAVGNDFDSGLRIQESFAKAGKELGQYLVKKVK